MNNVIEVATREAAALRSMALKLEIAGSIRRGKKEPRDADIVLIPKNNDCKKMITAYARKHVRGKIGQGENHLSYVTDGVEVELYFATPQSWGAMFLYATGPSRYNVIMRKLAKLRNMKLNQYGLWKRDTNELIAGETEEDIYTALGRNWKDPSRRGFMEKR